jgi:putative peptidoglycan lipid II flippase
MSLLLILFKRVFSAGSAIMMHRGCGFVREIMMTQWFGLSAVSDAILVATRIPTWIRTTTTEGALDGALIPLLNDMNAQHKTKLMSHLITRIIITFSISLFTVFLLQTLFAKTTLWMLSPGMLESQAKLYWFTKFIPYTSLTLIFFFLSGLFGAVLNYHGYFFLPSFAPVFWNLVLIVGMFLGNKYNWAFYTIGPMLLLAAMAQCLFTFIPYYRLRISIKLRSRSSPELNEKSDETFRLFLKRFFPIMGSCGVNQIINIVNMYLQSYLPSGNMSIIHLADKFFQLPMAAIVAFSKAVLPTLSATRDKNEKKHIMQMSLLMTLLIFLPVSLIFYFFGKELVGTLELFGQLFGFKKSYGYDNIAKVAVLLKIYAFAFPSCFFVRTIQMFCYSEKETTIPAIGASIQTLLNILFNIYFLPYGFIGFGYAYTIGVFAHMIFLFACLPWLMRRLR